MQSKKFKLLIAIVTTLGCLSLYEYASFYLNGSFVMRSIGGYKDQLTQSQPVQLDELNNELFCPIRNKSHKHGMYRLLQDIQKLQFLDDCFDQNQRFWIYDLTNGCSRVGLFAMLNCWSFYFTQAFILNRTFLFDGAFDDYAPRQYCYNKGYECNFLPVSNCNTSQIISYYNNKANKSVVELTPRSFSRLNVTLISTPYDVLNQTKLKHLQRSYAENVWVIKHFGFRKNTMKAYSLIKAKYNLNDENEYEALLWNFFLRLQPFLEQRINQIVMKSLLTANIINSNSHFWNNYSYDNISNDIISMPIRWSDKCVNNQNQNSKFRSEINCWNTSQYIEVAKILKKLKPNLKYILITSEEKFIVDQIVNHTDIGYKYITNVGDVMQGTGNLHTKNVAVYNNSILPSLLSTIRLHFMSKYFIFTKSSNWIYKIFKMKKFLECEPIKQFKIEQYTKKTLTCIELVMPWILGKFDRIYRTNNETKNKKIAILSNSLLDIYSQAKHNETHHFRVLVDHKKTCDEWNNLMYW